VTATLVHQVLEGIWTEKHETATRVRSRIENVLDYAISKGYREGPNPARLKGNLDHMLAPSKKVAKVEHHAARTWWRCRHSGSVCGPWRGRAPRHSLSPS